MGENLLLISVAAAADGAQITTMWSTSADSRSGPQLTRIERVAGEAELSRRLADLAPAVFGSSPLVAAT